MCTGFLHCLETNSVFLWKIRDKGKREDIYHVISDLQRSGKIRSGNSAGAYKF